jgi:hypothetical protein
MQRLSFQGRGVLKIVLALFLLASIYGWWLCWRSDATAFLPPRSGGQWIVDNQPPENIVRPARPSRTLFVKKFILDAPANGTTVSMCAFKTASVSINGKEVDGIKCSGKNWKQPVTTDVTALLKTGTNEIIVSVTNITGPPALWLRMQGNGFSLGSDETWLSSPTGYYWLHARCASSPPILPNWNPLKELMQLSGSVSRTGSQLARFAAVSLALIFCVNQLIKRGTLSSPAARIYSLFAVIAIARVALFIHDAPDLDSNLGFDASAHTEYIQFIQDKAALPLPNDGWEMHQPPLYYLTSAVELNILGLSAGNDNAALPLRSLNCAISLIHCWLVLLCLRRLFPHSLSAQAIGLLIAGFLPANLYNSFYVANDPLAGLLVTLAIYLFLRLLASEKDNPLLALGIGAVLGAAMLSKLTALLAVPVLLVALGLRLIQCNLIPLMAKLRSMGLCILACVLVCGWHFFRVWRQIGALPLPNSQTAPTSGWWQDPGYHTISYYLSFGKALATPLFSNVYSFADGIYSTLWADGLISGASNVLHRPPWNYDLMKLGCLLAIAVCLLAIIGCAVFTRKLIQKPEPTPLLITGTLAIFAAGIVLLTLRNPWMASVKAFYALPALLPFCAAIAAGSIWTCQKWKPAQPALWAILLVWAFTAWNSFWIRKDQFEYWRNQAIVQLQKHQYSIAADSVSHALELNPNDFYSHHIRAEILGNEGKLEQAMQECKIALKIRPDAPVLLDEIARVQSEWGKPDAENAVKLAARACELTSYRYPQYITTLALANAAAGQWEAASNTAQIAINLANGAPGFLKPNQDILNLCREHASASDLNHTPPNRR